MPHIYPHGCYFNSLDEINGKKITIMGLGLNGDGGLRPLFFKARSFCYRYRHEDC